jgi:hypothetical protein
MLRVQSPDRVLGDKSKLAEPGKSRNVKQIRSKEIKMAKC